MTEALNSSETSVLTRATWRNILEDLLMSTAVNVHHVAGPKRKKTNKQTNKTLYRAEKKLVFIYYKLQRYSIGFYGNQSE
jgi:hypothetical protein